MRCPVCNVTLTTADRQGVEVDFCPKCYGIWLDRGELSQILERSRVVEPEVVEFNRPGQPLETPPPHPDPDAGFGRADSFNWRRVSASR